MNWFDQPVVAALTPVFLLVAAGFVAGRLRWIRGDSVQDLSNLVFLVLIPALLFRTMSAVRFEQLDLRPVVAYFLAAVGWWGVLVVWRGFNPRSVVLALSGVFSNMVMIGITLVELAYGQAGLVTLLTLVSVHALTLLTLGSVTLELAQARQGQEGASVLRTLWSAIKGALIHPIPLPIGCGLLFAQTGWTLPLLVDKPLQLLGNAFGPLALVLVGVSLARTPLKGQWALSLWLAASKNVVLPLLVGCSAWFFGIRGLPFTVMVVAAALPIGANVFLFAQRYRVAQELTTAAMGVSTVLAVVTLSIIMWLLSFLGY
jgi:malonate transporter and related proteins